jgi:hypothetical protein
MSSEGERRGIYCLNTCRLVNALLIALRRTSSVLCDGDALNLYVVSASLRSEISKGQLTFSAVVFLLWALCSDCMATYPPPTMDPVTIRDMKGSQPSTTRCIDRELSAQKATRHMSRHIGKI